MKLGMCIMSPESPNQWVSACASLPLLGNGSISTFPLQRYTRNNRRIVERVVFYAVHVVLSKVSD
jgi:hypothetical protein